MARGASIGPPTIGGIDENHYFGPQICESPVIFFHGGRVCLVSRTLGTRSNMIQSGAEGPEAPASRPYYRNFGGGGKLTVWVHDRPASFEASPKDMP